MSSTEFDTGMKYMQKVIPMFSLLYSMGNARQEVYFTNSGGDMTFIMEKKAPIEAIRYQHNYASCRYKISHGCHL